MSVCRARFCCDGQFREKVATGGCSRQVCRGRVWPLPSHLVRGPSVIEPASGSGWRPEMRARGSAGGRQPGASAACLAGTFQPPVSLPGAHLPPAGDFFPQRQLEQFLERLALPVFDVGAPGAGHRLAAGRLRRPVALPPLAVLLRPPGAVDNKPSTARQRPCALGRVGAPGQGAARPASLQGLPAAGGGDPGPVEGLGRLLRNRAEKKEEKRDQPAGDGKRCPNETPPKGLPVAKPLAANLRNYEL